MQDTVVDKNHIKAISRIPFLAEFPFSEYSFQSHMMQSISPSTGQPIGEPMDVVLFSYLNDSNTMVNIMEKELMHLYEIRDNVTRVNEVASQVSAAMETTDVKQMSDAIKNAETWFKDIKGKKFNIGAGTFSDILTAFVGRTNIDELTRMSYITNRLYNGKGIVFITPEQKEILLNYFHFQLVYYKLLVGIMIAAKISLK
jgi:hypothetical protein